MLVWTWSNFTNSLHLPSTRSHVHISPASELDTIKLLSCSTEAFEMHKIGAVCPTNKHLGVISNVSGSICLQHEVLIT